MSDSATPNDGAGKKTAARKSAAPRKRAAQPAVKGAAAPPAKPEAPRPEATTPEATSPQAGITRPGTTGPGTGASARKAAKPLPAPRDDDAPVEVRAMTISLMDRRAMIAQAAYYRAERRRFAAGYELEDWLAAEAEIESLLGAAKPGNPRGS